MATDMTAATNCE